VSSDGFYEVAQRQTAGALGLVTAIKTANRNVRFLDGISHGFCVADVTPARVHVDYVWLSSAADPTDPRLDPRATASIGASWQSVRGSRVVSSATSAMGARSDQPRTLPRRRTRAAAPPVAAPTRSLPTTGGAPVMAAAGAAALATAALARLRRT
jgi:hypothetical protein